MGGFLKSAFFPDPDLEAGLAVTEGLAPGVMFINIFLRDKPRVFVSGKPLQCTIKALL